MIKKDEINSKNYNKVKKLSIFFILKWFIKEKDFIFKAKKTMNFL